MTTPPKELSSERCLQLREGGILRLWVNLLHEHTFELQDKPEADLNIELFLMDFNRKSKLRARLSQQIRTVVGHTAMSCKKEDELKILGWLEALRKYIERLYHYICDWKAMTEDADKLSEFTELAGQVKDIIEELIDLTSDDTTHPIFEQFGGVFVIVDYLHAQTRFNAKFHQFESDLIDLTQLLRVANASKLVLRYAINILNNVVARTDSIKDIRLFLGNSRSLHEIMVGIAEDAYDDGHLLFVHLYCCLLYNLYYIIVNGGVLPSTSHLKDCGVIKCLAKFCMEIKHPRTLYFVLLALEASLYPDRQNALEFVSIDGSVNMLIDVLVSSKKRQRRDQRSYHFRIGNFFRRFSCILVPFGGFCGQCLKKDVWYEKQRLYSTIVLTHITRHFFTQNRRLDGRLLSIYESRDFVAILVRYLEQITSINEDSVSTRCVLAMLLAILVSSEDQRRKFSEIGNGKEVVKRFESSDDEYYAKGSKWIGELFE